MRKITRSCLSQRLLTSTLFSLSIICSFGHTAFANGMDYLPGNIVVKRLCPHELMLTPFYNIVNQNSPVSYAENELCLNNMLSFSGAINADLWYSQRSGGGVTMFGGKGSQWGVGTRGMFDAVNGGLYGNLKNASLFIDAKPNDWVGGNLIFSYVGASSEQRTYYNTLLDISTSYHPSAALKVDEAAITIANPDVIPFYIRLGRVYLNSFGEYKPYPMVQSLTQLLTQSRTGALTGGMVLKNGIFASASWSMAQATLPELFAIPNDDSVTIYESVHINQLPEHNYSAKLGYIKECDNYGFNINISYLHDIRDVDYLTGFNDYIQENNAELAIQPFFANTIYLMNRAPAVAFHLDAHWKQFGFGFESANALRNMNLRPGSASSKIFAWGVNANYAFPFICSWPSQIDLAYQHSGNADIVYPFFNTQGITATQQFFQDFLRQPTDVGGLGLPGFSFPIGAGNILPVDRWQVTFTTDVWPELLSMSFQWVQDIDYSVTRGGTGRKSNIATARMSLQF